MFWRLAAPEVRSYLARCPPQLEQRYAADVSISLDTNKLFSDVLPRVQRRSFRDVTFITVWELDITLVRLIKNMVHWLTLRYRNFNIVVSFA